MVIMHEIHCASVHAQAVMSNHGFCRSPSSRAALRVCANLAQKLVPE